MRNDRRTNGITGLALALTLGSVAACEGIGDVVTTEPESVQSDLFIANGTKKWPNGVVNVCWEPTTAARANFANEAALVRNANDDYWPTYARVSVVGWGTICNGTPANTIRLRIEDNGGGNSPTGMKSDVMKLGALDAAFTTGLVPHEFGHALGFNHEQTRKDWEDLGDCKSGDVDGDTLYTPPDVRGTLPDGTMVDRVSEVSGLQSIMGCPGGMHGVWDAVGAKIAYGKRVNGISPLTTGWHSGREDNATVASDTGLASLRSEGYKAAYGDGWVFDTQMPGTVPLKLFWHAGRGDFFSTATAAGEAAAKSSGYTFMRNEGFIYPTQQPGTVPLKLFWHAKRGDNFTTTTSLGERRANAAGYTFVRVEGFVLAKRPYDLVWQYWHAGRGDNLMTGQKSSLAKGAEAAQYAFTGFDGVVLNQQLPGTVPLKTFWSAAREDNFETATAAGEQSALAAGYVFVRTEGFVFSSMAPGLVPMKSFFHAGRGDNHTTVGRAAGALQSGYTETRTEGFTFGINQ
jgi:hypothetical protein